jgi:hypothetical protein
MTDLELAGSCPFATIPQQIDIALLKAQVFGCWQKALSAPGTKSNHQNAVECYESALRLAGGLAEKEAEARFRYALFSLEAPEDIGGGKSRAIQNLGRAVELAPVGTALHVRCSEELARQTKKRWSIFG